MGGGGKPAFSTVNAGSPTRLLRLPSAGEARRDELLAAALERQTEGLRRGGRPLLERHRHDQAVDAELELRRVDPGRVDPARVGLREPLDRLAIEDELDGLNPGPADLGVERLRGA